MCTFWTDTALALPACAPVLTDPPLLSVYETGTKHKREHLLHIHLHLLIDKAMSEDGEEKKAAAAAPPAGLFGDDSSSSEDEEDEAAAAPAPAPAAAEGADRPAAEEGGERTQQSQPTSNAALFGDDDSSSDEDEVGAAPAAAASAETKEGSAAADAAKETAPAAAKPTNNAGLFGDDDSDDDEVAFDDIKGRSATDAERAAMSERAADLASKSVLPGSTADADMLGGDSAALQEGSQLGAAAAGPGQQQQPTTLRKKEPRRLEVLDIPRPADIHKSSRMSLHVTKLPNLVGIQAQPYDPDTHDPEQEEIDYRGYTHSMIRWRYKKTGGSDGTFDRDENGKLVRESNARFVKWSDGSYTLHVGPEVFEVDQIGLPKPPAPGTAQAAAAAKAKAAGVPPPTTYPGLNGYVYLTQTIRAAQSDATGEPLPDLVNRTILECQGPITSKLVPRPSSLQSAAHKNLTLAVRQRNMKKARIQEMVTVLDPEAEKAKRMKAKEDLAKQEARRGARGGHGGGGRRSGARVGVNLRYLEEDEDDDHYDTVNVSRMKRRMMDKDESMDYGESSGEEEDEWSQRKRSAKKRKPVESSSDEEELDFGDDDEDEEEAVIMSKNKAAAGKKRTHQAIDDDDDDD